ncbi:MAG: MBOAT family protein [Planctomycetes bacterium]|nr:MBOAT family protein [Planctomycetota bacterium]
MVFSTTVFLLAFLPIVLVVHFLVPRGLRNAWLLLASLFFYAWGEKDVVLVMVASIIGNYVAGLLLEGRRGTRKGRVFLALALTFDLGILVFYKYLNFLGDSFSALLTTFGGHGLDLPEIALPIGISFFTFQGMSYVIDVYRGDVAAQRRPDHFGMYIALFPQLVAGPIVRYAEIAEEIRTRFILRWEFANGVRRFVLGLGKKMLLANTAARVADHVFDLPLAEVSTGLAWVGVIAYTLQIYFDFSGYSDMAIGLGQMLGFTFPENFNYPYIARSITEFWRRWHMTLSRWFRDYLYIPLGGNRVGSRRTYVNLWIVFLLCGLWHGDQWTFVVWGAYHGSFLVLERAGLGRTLEVLPRLLRHVYTLLVVMVGWVFFRSLDLEHALGMLATMAGFTNAPAYLHPVAEVLTTGMLVFLVLGVIGTMPWLPWLVGRTRPQSTSPDDGFWLWEGIGALFVLCVLALSMAFLASGTHNPFIYFRF